MKRAWRIAGWALAAIVVCSAAIVVFNASWRVAPPEGGVKLVAHRGVYQTYDRTGIDNDTCTATRIRLPIVPEIENTLPSMQAAFAAGADVVELDVHPTTDGQFAVFHDWTLDCRTEGTGPTREHDMAYLKTLDVGYGYTADGGKTYPLRGTGIGMMPSLEDVMRQFPDGRFLINFKSKEAREGDMLAALLSEHPDWRASIWGVYGGAPPTARAIETIPDLRGYSVDTLKACLLPYEALGWSGYLPDGCRNTLIALPLNFAPWLWGWPNLFLQRMQDAGTSVILSGDYGGGAGQSGIDSESDFARIPAGYSGYVLTNDIMRIASLRRDR